MNACWKQSVRGTTRYLANARRYAWGGVGEMCWARQSGTIQFVGINFLQRVNPRFSTNGTRGISLRTLSSRVARCFNCWRLRDLNGLYIFVVILQIGNSIVILFYLDLFGLSIVKNIVFVSNFNSLFDHFIFINIIFFRRDYFLE